MKRIEKPEDGGGCGSTFFEGAFFDVRIWHWNNSFYFTEICLKNTDFSICFDGDERDNFKTEEDCFNSIGKKDFFKIIHLISESSFDKGKEEGECSVKRKLQDLIFN